MPRFLCLSIGLWAAFCFSYLESAICSPEPSYRSEDANLGVSHFVMDVAGRKKVYLEIQNFDFDQVRATFTTDGWKTKKKATFKKVERTHFDRTWRVELGEFSSDQTVEFAIYAKDRLGSVKHWDSKNGQNYKIDFSKERSPAPQNVQTRLRSSGPIPADTPVQVRVKAVHPENVDQILVRYTTDGWKTTQKKEIPNPKSKEDWDIQLGPFPDGQEVQYAVGVVEKNGNAVWDNNKSRNYQFKVGAKGYTPPDYTLKQQKETLKNSPQRAEDLKIIKEFRKQHPIYVSMTSSPKRLGKILHVLDTLDLDLIDGVILALPLKYQGKTEYQIPEEIKNHPKIRVVRVEKDLGPITKILPAIEEVRKMNAADDGIVISVDDDIGYPRGMLKELLIGAITKQGTAISGSGQNLAHWKIPSFAMPQTQENQFGKQHHKNSEYEYVDVVEGFAGIAYHPKWVDVELMKYLTTREKFRECFASDDLVISFVLAYSGVNRMRVNNRYYHAGLIEEFPYGLEEDALHQGSGLEGNTFSNPVSVNEEKYQKCYQMLIEATFDFNALKLKDRNSILSATQSPMPSRSACNGETTSQPLDQKNQECLKSLMQTLPK